MAGDRTTRTIKVAAPSSLATPTAIRGASQLFPILNTLLADGLTLWLKTKNYHWHVIGPHFNDYHSLFDTQADAIYATLDTLAERVRKLGGATVRGLGEVMILRTLTDDETVVEHPDLMLNRLLADNTRMVDALRSASLACDAAGDIATANILQEFLDQTERRVWMLYATLQEVTP